MPGGAVLEPGVLGPGLPFHSGLSCDLLVALSRCSPHASLSPVFGPGQLALVVTTSLPCRDSVDSDQFSGRRISTYTEVQMKESCCGWRPHSRPGSDPRRDQPPLCSCPASS